MDTSARRHTTAPATDDRFDVPLRGIEVDTETRCAHYDSEEDIIAIRFPCCDVYYPCYRCHEATTDHVPERFTQAAFDSQAIYCGRCHTTHSVDSYLESIAECPTCSAPFNPDCEAHHDRYFGE